MAYKDNFTQMENRLRNLTRLQEEARTFCADLGQRNVSMTDATEILWGTSGRGNPKAVARLEVMAKLQLGIKIERFGRARYVERVKLPPGRNLAVRQMADYIKQTN